MFLKIGRIIISQDFISHCIIDGEAERISINLKSGAMFIFGKMSETFDSAGKQKGITYLSSTEFNSLRCFLKGDFCHNVA